MLLSIEDLHVGYGLIEALHGITFNVEEGEIVTLIGANGAGKSTTLMSIMRLPPPEAPAYRSGRMTFQGTGSDPVSTPSGREPARDLPGPGRTPDLREPDGLGESEDRRLCPQDPQTDSAESRVDLRALSPAGGTPQPDGRHPERRGAADARRGPGHDDRGKMMLLDEPSMGLAPFLMYELFHVLKEINQQGTTILLVEQNARIALKYAHRGYVLETGNIVLEGSGKDLAQDEKIKKAYLGK